MAAACLGIYYNPYNKNCRYIVFMNYIPEEEFVRGMKYVFVEASIQLITSVCLLAFLHKKLRIDVFRVGQYILLRNPLFFWIFGLAPSIYFLGLHVQHLGYDETFNFAWLFDENVTHYVPADAPADGCQIFNVVSPNSTISETLEHCVATFSDNCEF